MINTEIIYNALNKPNVEDLEKIRKECFICGKEINQGLVIKKVLSSNFTNFNECKSLNSTHICKECSYSLKDANLRRNNIISDENNLYLLKKNDLEEYLFNLDKYVKGEFIVGITTSFKKHNSFRCRVNTDTKNYYIRQEDKEYLFEIKKLKPLYEKLNEAYLQFSKDEIQTGNYKMISIEQFGLEKFIEYENLFKQFRGSHQFELLLYILNSEKRNEYIQEKIKIEKEEKAKLKQLEKQNKNSQKKGDK